MSLHIENEVKAAWKALSEIKESSGWQAVPVSSFGPCKVMAAKRFPENEDALLVGFELKSIPDFRQLPKGKGFRVESIYDDRLGSDYRWIGLIKLDSGSSDIFLGMIRDILNILGEKKGLSQNSIFNVFLGRIRAWQEFMSRPSSELSSEAEIGLYGELCFLKSMLRSDIELFAAIDSWQGPLDGLQDFLLGCGAVEVKSTIAENGFPAKIFSLDQLDDSMLQPIYIGAIRLKVDTSGITLPMMVEKIRKLMSLEPLVLAEFDSRLLRAGYLDSHKKSYTREFVVKEMRNVLVDSNFPRLIPAIVPVGIKAVKYEIDIDQVDCVEVPSDVMFKQLGVV